MEKTMAKFMEPLCKGLQGCNPKLGVCTYIYIYIYVFICIYIYMFMYMCKYTYMYMYIQEGRTGQNNGKKAPNPEPVVFFCPAPLTESPKHPVGI